MVGPAHEQHRGHDRARPGQQRSSQRYQRHVRRVHLLRVVRLPGQQLQRDPYQQQPARALQRRQVDPQVPQDLLAGDREHHDHPAGQRDRLPPGPVPVPGRHRPGQSQEDRYHAGRVRDHQQGHEHLDEQLAVHTGPTP